MHGTHVLNESLNGSDVDDLTGADIRDEGLTGADLKDGTVRQGDLGIVRVSSESAGGGGESKTATASCPAGTLVISGGGEILDGDTGDYWEWTPYGKSALRVSRPATGNGGWTIVADRVKYPPLPEFTLAYDGKYVTGFKTWISQDNWTYTKPWKVRAYAICAAA